MSTLRINNLQIGQLPVANNNFTWYQPSTPDGTIRLGNGNAGAVTDILIGYSNGSVVSTGTLSANAFSGPGTGLTSIPTSALANSSITINGTSINFPVSLNDISTQFDGYKTVFDLVLDQTNINTLSYSKDLEVIINGVRLNPYIDTYTYPWLTPYDSYKGFRVKTMISSSNTSINVGKVIIYNAPYIGDSSCVVYKQVTQTNQTKRYPFAATTIALGD